MNLDHNIAIMVRETVAGNACVSATRWNRGQRCQRLCCGARLAALTFPLAPFLSLTGRRRGRMGCGVNLASPTRHAQRLTLPAQQRERVASGGTERWPPNSVVAQARYFPIKNPDF